MRALAEFAKTTLIGGLLIILPIYISVLLLLKALKGLLGLLAQGCRNCGICRSAWHDTAYAG